ncbi:MAG: glycosyltransferase [Vicinamibacteraceae bacterium]
MRPFFVVRLYLAALLLWQDALYRVAFLVQTLCVVLALEGTALRQWSGRGILGISYYFSLANCASRTPAADLSWVDVHMYGRHASDRRMKALWMTWEHHRRTREIASSLTIPLLELVSTHRGLRRYILLLVRTTACLVRQRPTHVFVQCPSVVLGFWLTIVKPLLGYRLIADLHNAAVEPLGHGADAQRWILRRLHRNADVSLVTNTPLSSIVQSNGGRPFVLPDRIPTMGPPLRSPLTTSGHLVVFVCSFAPDEPYRDVIQAARLLTDVAAVHVTGRVPDGHTLDDLPPNVRLTGYLSDTAYEQLLQDADVVVDLTTRENCLVCGAYEAVALRKPLVTSDTSALRGYFRRGTIFTRHDPRSVADAIITALNRRAELGAEMGLLRQELVADWESRRAELLAHLGWSDERVT